MEKPIYVTNPFLVPLKKFENYLKKIWNNKWLTNNGEFHQELELKLADFLQVPYVSLTGNGTLALMLAIKALDLKGEIVTTPFSFVATTHAICWQNCRPVFCDIESNTLNIDPQKIESLITDKTSAIMPVHVYGNPCDHENIQRIARKHDLKIIYDAAHAFNVKKKEQSILNWGDLAVLSFHATKVFNTFEGGAIICQNIEMKKKIDLLKNFGFENETTVSAIGINAKMNEFQAAFGLMQLDYVEENIKKRKAITDNYRRELADIEGISCLKISEDVRQNYSFFPILVDKDKYGLSRDELYEKLKENNVYARRYFYPLISNFPSYRGYTSAKTKKLPVANKIADQIICLPIYLELTSHQLAYIIQIIK